MDEDWNRRNRDPFGDDPRRDGFGHFFHGGFGDDFFQPFREMMHSFFADIHPEMNHSFESIEPARPEGHEFLNPRDRMLKRTDPYEEPFHRDHNWYDNIFATPQFPPAFHPSETEDQDLDDRISSENLGSMMMAPPQTSFFKSFSSRTVRSADGKIEEERTIRDSSGKEEKILKRVIGDQIHTITTKRHTDGGEEIIEDMVNMDESSLTDFNKNWNSKIPQDLVPMHIDPHQPLPNASGFMDVFKKFFGYNRRDD